MMKRIKIEKLQPGDIILTASNTKAGKVVRLATGGAVSHAMICVQHGSFIDSTSNGVQAWNMQREFFDDEEETLGSGHHPTHGRHGTKPLCDSDRKNR